MDFRQTSRLRIAIMSGLTVSVLIAFSLFYLLHPAIRARFLFNQMESLQLGHSTFDDAQRLARKIGAYPSDGCQRSKCRWHARLDNASLPRWWRGSGEVFAVDFAVENSIVIRKNTGYGIEGSGIDAFSPSSVGLIEQEHWGRRRIPEPVMAGWSSSELFRYYEFTVYMTPKATAEDRRRYTAYDYGCLWRFKGCKDARELLPTADPMPADN
jgi:hypothetical protein